MRFLTTCWALLLPLYAQALETGHTAPDFNARLLDGRSYALTEHHGEVVLLHFWASWCDSCQAELDALRTYAQAHAGAKLSIVSVSMDDPEQRARVVQMAKGLPFPTAMSDDAQAQGYGRIWRLPMNFVIDRKGLLRLDGGQGDAQPLSLPTLEKILTPLLQNE